MWIKCLISSISTGQNVNQTPDLCLTFYFCFVSIMSASSNICHDPFLTLQLSLALPALIVYVLILFCEKNKQTHCRGSCGQFCGGPADGVYNHRSCKFWFRHDRSFSHVFSENTNKPWYHAGKWEREWKKHKTVNKEKGIGINMEPDRSFI